MFRQGMIIAAVAAGLLSGFSVCAENQVPNWEELEKHDEAPDWFRDAKFGIYAHWGVYSSPAFKKGAFVTFTLKPTSKKDWKAVNVRELELKWEEELRIKQC